MTITEIQTKTSRVSFTPGFSKQATNAVLAALGAASTDRAREVLCKVKINVDREHGNLKLVATNSYRANVVLIKSLDISGEDMPEILVDAKELKDALPKPSEFKANGTDYLTIEYFPGRAKLDAGQLAITWGNNQRMIRADVDGGILSFPTVQKLVDGAITEQPGTVDGEVGWSPTFLKDIATEAKKIQGTGEDREAPLRYHAAPTAMKPGLFSLYAEGVSYQCLLMPVRIME